MKGKFFSLILVIFFSTLIPLVPIYATSKNLAGKDESEVLAQYLVEDAAAFKNSEEIVMVDIREKGNEDDSFWCLILVVISGGIFIFWWILPDSA